MTAEFDRRDEEFMEAALVQAYRGVGRVEPNPLAGAVIVKDGQAIAWGHHARFGGHHAEIAALRAAGDRARGATVYVTLEPCGHEGKTPPCARALIRAGVGRVVYAADDPHEVTAGKGPAMLAEAGIPVEGGLLAGRARSLNEPYLRHLSSPLPWVIAKWAMTLDGKTGDARGGSIYITGKESRELVHEIRGAVDAIVVGVGTVLADDPSLTVRHGERTRNPVRIVVDSRLRSPPGAVVARTARDHPTWIACREDAPRERAEALEAAGCRILRCGAREGRVDLGQLFAAVKREGVARVLLEGGGTLHAAALADGLVKQVMAFTAPKILGGVSAPTPVGGEGLREVGDALRLTEVRTERLGDDVLVEGFL